MAVYNRGNVWWFESSDLVKRIRESANTSRKPIALEAQKKRRLVKMRSFDVETEPQPEQNEPKVAEKDRLFHGPWFAFVSADGE